MKSTCILWTPEMDDVLRECIEAKMSARETAEELWRDLRVNVSRQSAIGRAYRKGWQFKSEHLRNTVGRPKRPPRPRLVRHRLEPITVPLEPLPEGPLNDFPAAGLCRWPHGDPGVGPWRCCGVKQAAGSHYCEHHEARSRNTTGQKGVFVRPKTALEVFAA